MDIRDWAAPVAGRLDPTLRVLDAIAGWCGGLHGSMPLKDALETLASGLGSEAAALTRHHANEDRSRTVAVYDAREGDIDVPLLRRGVARDAMGYLYDKARASTAWFLTDLLTDQAWSGSNLLENWRISRDMAEIVTLPLAIDARHRDFLELHFTRAFSHADRLELEALVPTLVRSWAGRKSGLVTEASMDDRMIAARRVAAQAGQDRRAVPVLDMSNPTSLSRAEFRVCLLLSRGLSVKAVTDELRLSEATIRTHLRSIYSKTETTGMPELLYRILSSGAASETRRAIAR